MYLNHRSLRTLSFSKCYSLLYFQKFCFTSCSTANLVTVIADRIANVLSTSGAAHAVVLDVSKDFYSMECRSSLQI